MEADVWQTWSVNDNIRDGFPSFNHTGILWVGPIKSDPDSFYSWLLTLSSTEGLANDYDEVAYFLSQNESNFLFRLAKEETKDGTLVLKWHGKVARNDLGSQNTLDVALKNMPMLEDLVVLRLTQGPTKDHMMVELRITYWYSSLRYYPSHIIEFFFNQFFPYLFKPFDEIKVSWRDLLKQIRHSQATREAETLPQHILRLGSKYDDLTGTWTSSLEEGDGDIVGVNADDLFQKLLNENARFRETIRRHKRAWPPRRVSLRPPIPRTQWFFEIGPIRQAPDTLATWIRSESSAKFSGFRYPSQADKNMQIRVDQPSWITLTDTCILISWTGEREHSNEHGELLSKSPTGVILWSKIIPMTTDEMKVWFGVTVALNDAELWKIHETFYKIVVGWVLSLALDVAAKKQPVELPMTWFYPAEDWTPIDTVKISMEIKTQSGYDEKVSALRNYALDLINETQKQNSHTANHTDGSTSPYTVPEAEARARRRGGGPKGTPLNDRRKAVEGWIKAQEQGMIQEVYCSNIGCSVSTLGRWINEYIAGQLGPPNDEVIQKL